MKKLITFKGTEDYSKLNHLPFNRQFKVRQDLIQSFNEWGFQVPINLLKTDLISGKNEIFIIDGQHRAITASFLNIPFEGILLDVKIETIPELVKFVSSLNSLQKKWSIKDYANAYAFLNYQDYKELIKITTKTPYTLGIVANLLMGFRTRGSVGKKIENGTFKITQRNETARTLAIAANLSKFEKMTGTMILALHYVSSLTSFDEEKFTKKYRDNAKSIKDLKLDDYTDTFSSWL